VSSFERSPRPDKGVEKVTDKKTIKRVLKAVVFGAIVTTLFVILTLGTWSVIE
jgi:hypothetical protein